MTQISTPASVVPALATASATAASGSAIGLWLPAMTLWRREMVRFFRQKNRVASALITPVLMWLMLGAGLNNAFTNPAVKQAASVVEAGAQGSSAGAAEAVPAGGGYMLYFFPGTITMILLFTAIFSTITVIEDRREGFLQGVLVSPAPRLSIALGKVLGGASIAMIHALVFLLIYPFAAGGLGNVNFGLLLAAIPIMAVLAIGMTGLGMCIAWPMDSTAAFHAIMMIFLMPMWFLSGAIFPVDGAPIGMKIIMLCNPLTYGHDFLATVLTGGRATSGVPVPLWVSGLITLAFAAGVMWLATRQVARPRKDGLP